MKQEDVKRYFNYNPETGVIIWKVPTANRIKEGDIAGTIHHSNGRQIRIFGKSYLATRLIWLYVYGKLPIEKIYHKNNISWDDRLDNLIEATQDYINKHKYRK